MLFTAIQEEFVLPYIPQFWLRFIGVFLTVFFGFWIPLVIFIALNKTIYNRWLDTLDNWLAPFTTGPAYMVKDEKNENVIVIPRMC